MADARDWYRRYTTRYTYPPWHFLYFLPLPQGHRPFRPILPCSLTIAFRSSQSLQVHAGGCMLNQLVLGMVILSSVPL